MRFNGDVNETDAGGHGTGVTGIVGAKGNNGIGGVGVNWDVKLMTIVWGDRSGNEEVILRSFNYAYIQRKLYNETGGKKGAYVVAINASWGVPGLRFLSTGLREGFREFSGGTSFAAPQVAGSIALLYSSPCVQLADLAQQSPAEAALLARRLILDGAEPIADLRGKVVTGGDLRVDKSLRLLSAYCYAEAQQSPKLLAHPNPFHEQLLVPIRSTQAIENATLEVFNLQGQRMYSQQVNVPADFPGLVEIDANSWPQGMYLLRLRWGGKEMVAQKVVKI